MISMDDFDHCYQSIRDKPVSKLKKILFKDLEPVQKQIIKDSISRGSIIGSFADENDSMNFLIEFFKKNHIYLSCICDAPLKEGREFLSKMLYCFNIENLNIDEALVRIIIDSTFYRIRISDWNVSEIDVITDTQEKIKLHCYSTECKEINNWKQEYDPYPYSIICNDNQIVWYTFFAHFDSKPEYFVMQNKKIYGLSFGDKSEKEYYGRILNVYHHLGDLPYKVRLSIDKIDKIDKAIVKQKSDKPFDKIECIDLAERFKNGFFYKGPLWDENWKGPFIKIIITGFVGKFLKIKIINMTYPHTGFILLDIEDKKVVMAQKDIPKITTEEEALASMNPNDDFALSHIPDELKTAKVCLEAVKENPEALLFVPEEQMTEELCFEAVKADGWALQFVPPIFKTAKVCLEAVKNYGTVLEDVPYELKSLELCFKAVKQNEGAIIYVPEEMRSRILRRLNKKK